MSSATHPRNRGPGRTACLFGLAIAFVLLLTPALAPGVSAGDGSAAAMNRWYLAEGFTGPGFQEYVCVGNSSGVPAGIKVSFLFNAARSIEQSYTVPARSRYTIDVNRVVGPGKEVSVIVSSASGSLAVERSVYFNYKGRYPGSHTARAATSTSRSWFFAEGFTGQGFEEYLCVLNPGDAPAALTLHFQSTSGDEVRGGLSVPAYSRQTFSINDLVGRDKEVSIKLESDRPVVAERPMYFDYPGAGNNHWEGGHCVMGTAELATEYFLAEGTTRQGFEEWLTIQNPNDAPISVRAVYQFGPGQGPPVRRSYPVDGRRRRTVFVPDEVGRDTDVSVRLTATAPFLAERPLYYSQVHSGLSFEGGQCAMGVAATRKQWFLAEGYTGPYFEQWLCIQNTEDEQATVVVEYYTREVGALPARTVIVPGRTRVTILVNEHAGPNLQLSTRLTVSQGPGVVVERPMYFERNLGMPVDSGSDILFGMCFSPYLKEDPLDGGSVSVEGVAFLMDKIAPYTRWIRTFCSQGEWDAMPALAIERGLKVAAGCDIHRDLARNQLEVDSLVAQIKRGEVDLACVGDEVMLANALSEDRLIGYIRRVKAAGAVTTTSESYTEIIAHPRIAAECDVITANIFPYWEGLPVEEAVAHLDSCYRDVQKAVPGKKIIVETGWPTGGQEVGRAVPSPANAARYLEEFMRWAYDRSVEYFYFESFDELWKAGREGPCGSNWGLWTTEAALKPEAGAVIRPRR